MKLPKIHIIETPSEAGAGTRGASLGPQSVYLQSLKEKSGLFEGMDWEVATDWNDEISTEGDTPNALNIELVVKAVKASNPIITTILNEGKRPFIFSGDHSNASAGIAAVSDHYGVENTGVIWIDAHADLHSPYTTPTGNMHGMPLAAMLNDDNLPCQINQPHEAVVDLWQSIKELGNGNTPKLLAKNIVFIGIRDLEQPEWDMIERLNIKFFGPKDIAKLGIKEVCDQAKTYLSKVSNWYVSFDVDSIDPNISMGTGTPVALGLSKEESFYCTQTFFNDAKTKAFEVTEINPLLDSENKMAAFVHDLLYKLWN